MNYYNSLVAEKLKIISEIQRLNKMIDAGKQDGQDSSNYLEKLELMRTELELINVLILSHQLEKSNLPLADPNDAFSSRPEDSESSSPEILE